MRCFCCFRAYRLGLALILIISTLLWTKAVVSAPLDSDDEAPLPPSPAGSSSPSSGEDSAADVFDDESDWPPLVPERLKLLPAGQDQGILSVHPKLLISLRDSRVRNGFRLGEMRGHPVSISPDSRLEIRAFKLLQDKGTRIYDARRAYNDGEDRIRVVPGSQKKFIRLFLMTPAPVNAEWYEMMHIPFSPETVHQPMLFHEYNTHHRAKNDFVKLLGVGIVSEPEDPEEFLKRWKEHEHTRSLLSIRWRALWVETFRVRSAP